ncbi:MAG: DUF3987 domain-containing protein [Planctomycetes bacterium]|nr:DUF3987 domain-containing protein [Planctomycetota bacterium]
MSLSLFSGKNIIVVPDHDETGIRGGEAFACEICPYVPEVKIPDISQEIPDEVNDFRDLMNHNRQSGIEYQSTVDRLLKQAEELPAFQPEQKPGQDTTASIEHDKPEEYESIPTDCFPPVLSHFIVHVSESIGCDPSFVAMPLLSIVGSLIGMTRELFFNRGYRIPPILWTAIIGESGTGKSPGFYAAMKPLLRLQTLDEQKNCELLSCYDKDIMTYDIEIKKWTQKLSNSDTIPPDEPDKPEYPPIKAHCVDDTTTEKLAELFRDNPKGVLQHKDELSGLFGGFDKYTAAKGSDSALYLKLYDASSIQVHRKSQRLPLYVKRAALSLTGGIQPDVFKSTMTNDYRQNGMLARFIFANPPPKPLPFPSEEGTPKKVLEQLDELFDTLNKYQPYRIEEDCFIPLRVYLTNEARNAYQTFYEGSNDEWYFSDSQERSAWSKLKSTALRIALIFHCVENAQSSKENQRISKKTMLNAIRLVEWFKKETLHVYQILEPREQAKQTPKQSQRTRLIEYIKGKGGTVTIRQVQRGIKHINKSVDAAKALKELVEDDLGKMVNQESDKPGQPQLVFQLFAPSTGRQLTALTKNSGDDQAAVDSKAWYPQTAAENTPEQSEEGVPDDLGEFMDEQF